MKTTCKPAFSLLELMIVLTIMVGVLAVAWPSLRRPMADSSVQQAANLLREQISDCRQLAAIQGQPRLMRFAANDSLVKRGSWNHLVVEQLADSGSLTGSNNAANEAEDAMGVDSWELPVDIVVDEVQLDQRTYSAADESSAEAAEIGDATSQWYLPFLPSGQTRDAVIVLRDSVTGSRVALEIEAVTGMMRTARLSATASLHSASGDQELRR